MTSLQLWAQLVGLFGAALMTLSFQFRSSRTLVICQTAGSILFFTQFLMLNALTGAILNLVVVVRGLCLSTSKRVPFFASRTMMWIISALFLIAGIVTYENWLSILPTAASVVSTVYLWSQNGKKIRLSQLFCVSPFWLIYNICVLSLTGALTETVNIISVLISIARYGIKNLDNTH